MIKNYNRRDFVSRLFGATVMSMAAPVILGELIPTLCAKAGVLSGIYSFKITDFPALTVGGLVWISVPNMPAPFKNKKLLFTENQKLNLFLIQKVALIKDVVLEKQISTQLLKTCLPMSWFSVFSRRFSNKRTGNK